MFGLSSLIGSILIATTILLSGLMECWVSPRPRSVEELLPVQFHNSGGQSLEGGQDPMAVLMFFCSMGN